MNIQNSGKQILRLFCIIVMVFAIAMLCIECDNLSHVNKNDQVYQVKHVIATKFVNVCSSQKRVLTTFKDTLSEYERLINIYANSGDSQIKEFIFKRANLHEEMNLKLENDIKDLNNAVRQNSKLLSDDYMIDMKQLQKTSNKLKEVISRITISNPKQYIFIKHLKLTIYGDFVNIEPIVDSLFLTYNLERATNFNQHLRKSEIFSQHFVGMCAALISLLSCFATIFFTIWPLGRSEEVSIK